MKLTIHRGSHEIGGSCVELGTDTSRIVIDIGIPLVDAKGERFDSRSLEGLSGPELVKCVLLQDIEGFYQWDNSPQRVDGLPGEAGSEDGFKRVRRSLREAGSSPRNQV